MKPINILLILSLLLLGSCVDKDLNNDPTKSANLNPNFQLTGIELRQWGSMDIGSICNRYMSPLTQQMQGNWDATNYGGQYRNDDNQIKSLFVDYFIGLQGNAYICSGFRAKRSPEGHQNEQNINYK